MFYRFLQINTVLKEFRIIKDEFIYYTCCQLILLLKSEFSDTHIFLISLSSFKYYHINEVFMNLQVRTDLDLIQ